MKAWIFVVPTVFFAIYFIYSPNHLDYDFQVYEEEKSGEVNPIRGANIDLDGVRAYGKDTALSHVYKANTDFEGRATISAYGRLFSLPLGAFCIEIEDLKYCANRSQLFSHEPSFLLEEVSVDPSRLDSRSLKRECFAKVDNSDDVKKVEVGCRLISKEPEISALRERITMRSALK